MGQRGHALGAHDADPLMALFGYRLADRQGLGGCLYVMLRGTGQGTVFDPATVRLPGAMDAPPQMITARLDLKRRPATFAWGTISLMDGSGAANSFVTFGGAVGGVSGAGGHVIVAESEAPILRAGGRHHGFDPLAVDAHAFMGRMSACLILGGGPHPDTSPRVLYGAFLRCLLARTAASPALQAERPELIGILRREARLLEAGSPGDWDRAEAVWRLVDPVARAAARR
jgi:hypothetical protein